MGCEIRKNLHHRSDHYPIATYLDLSLNIEPEIKKCEWKSADLAEVLQAAKEQRFNLPILANEADINMYVVQITNTLHQIEEKTVPWTKPSSKAQLFWNPECRKLIKTARKLRRQYEQNCSAGTWEEYQHIQAQKGKAIRRAKILHFRESIHDAANFKKRYGL